jgi:hypothetical protein
LGAASRAAVTPASRGHAAAEPRLIVVTVDVYAVGDVLTAMRERGGRAE